MHLVAYALLFDHFRLVFVEAEGGGEKGGKTCVTFLLLVTCYLQAKAGKNINKQTNKNIHIYRLYYTHNL